MILYEFNSCLREYQTEKILNFGVSRNFIFTYFRLFNSDWNASDDYVFSAKMLYSDDSAISHKNNSDIFFSSDLKLSDKTFFSKSNLILIFM